MSNGDRASTQPDDFSLPADDAAEIQKRIPKEKLYDAIARAIKSGNTDDYRAAQIAQSVLKASGDLANVTGGKARVKSNDPKKLATEALALLEDPDIKALLTPAPKERDKNTLDKSFFG